MSPPFAMPHTWRIIEVFIPASPQNHTFLADVGKIFICTHYFISHMETDIDCFECLVCGYIYDPEAGDPVGGVPSGVKFFSLPDDWLCPECSAGKDEFALVEL